MIWQWVEAHTLHSATVSEMRDEFAFFFFITRGQRSFSFQTAG